MVTVEELMLLCAEEVKKGNGKKEILISDDDEGNGFHHLFYSFQDDKVTKEYGYDSEKQILLG